MREIKFRAWFPKNHWYHQGMLCGWENCQGIESLTFSPDSVAIMQYTGLKDKNGKEIYEGDIVHCEGDYMGATMYNAEVKYSEGRFIPLVQVEEGYNAIDKYNAEKYEVIGNIYENPELLEESE